MLLYVFMSRCDLLYICVVICTEFEIRFQCTNASLLLGVTIKRKIFSLIWALVEQNAHIHCHIS